MAAHELLHALTETLAAFADPMATQPDRVAALRAAARAARHGSLEISDGGGQVTVDGQLAPALALGEDAVMRAMRAHGIRRLVVRRHAGARDIAQLAGLLARQPSGSAAESGVALVRELDELRLWSVRLVPTEDASDAPLPDAVEAALKRLVGVNGAAVSDAVQALVSALTDAVKRDPAQRARTVAHAIARALVDAPEVAREAVREALRAQAATVPILVALADAVVATDERTRQDARTVFEAAGPAGPQGLVALLASASTIRQRRRCFDALIAVGGAVPALTAALFDAQWYVVRNAAQLLGELRAEEACGALERTLHHADTRVQVAAAAALEQIDTVTARAALQTMAADQSPEVRRIAARAFGGDTDGAGGPIAPGAQPVQRLIAALDRETDPETFLEQIRALGAVGTPDAIQRLLRLVSGSAHPPQPLAARLAALDALVHARGSAAVPMLRELRQDRDPAMRAAARRWVSSVAA
ncbi:hypothetical protein J421_0964 [Gemmatirosa kalamazoonensis]|uniref:PBS lyase HEAT domain protein repeat-containing protein n=1 Tax=Gemmatirosa kalamazoonensis TaxID=861299 RepID=W0RCI2_9BACT|nr:HEAT repeat domain-containing protein [Gemmatirosa kalamazoonensis]AHG88501.1 hypothetical protein J421_0964 [Gemmatirosa kalamazoonensis]